MFSLLPVQTAMNGGIPDPAAVAKQQKDDRAFSIGGIFDNAAQLGTTWLNFEMQKGLQKQQSEMELLKIKMQNEVKKQQTVIPTRGSNFSGNDGGFVGGISNTHVMIGVALLVAAVVAVKVLK